MTAGIEDGNVEVTGQAVVPEPATLLLTGSGLATLLASKRRRNRR